MFATGKRRAPTGESEAFAERGAGNLTGSGAPLSAKPVVWPVAAVLLRDTGGVAQLGEHLLCKQGVIGSIPFTSTKIW